MTHIFKILTWLMPVVIAWGGLSYLGHQTSHDAITWTGKLFGPLLLVTYIALWGAVASASVKPRLMVIRGIATTITLMIMLAFLEAPAVFKIVNWQLLFDKASGEENRYTWSYLHDSELGFRRRPGDTWSGRPPSDIEGGSNMPVSIKQPITFTYDKWGYRNLSDQNQVDVIMIGDSYIEGWYVSDDETAAFKLQENTQYQVANLGVAGYGSKQELIVLHKEVPRLKPRVVIWSFFEGNDLYDDEGFENTMLSTPQDDSEFINHPEGIKRDYGWESRSFTLHGLKRLRRWLDPIIPNRTLYFAHMKSSEWQNESVYFADYAGVPWSDWIDNRWQNTKETLKKAVAYTEEQNIKLIIMYVPIKYRVYQSYINVDADSPINNWDVWQLPAQFSEFCDKVGADCIDLTEMFKASVRDGKMPYAINDTHWGVEGHRIVAEQLELELRQRGW